MYILGNNSAISMFASLLKEGLSLTKKITPRGGEQIITFKSRHFFGKALLSRKPVAQLLENHGCVRMHFTTNEKRLGPRL